MPMNMNISMAISWNWTLLKSRRRSTRGGKGLQIKSCSRGGLPRGAECAKLYVMRRPCSRRTCQLSRRWRIRFEGKALGPIVRQVGYDHRSHDENTGTELTLQFLLDLNIQDRIDEVQEITVSADKEYKLEKNLEAMKQEWAEIEFDVKPTRRRARRSWAVLMKL